VKSSLGTDILGKASHRPTAGAMPDPGEATASVGKRDGLGDAAGEAEADAGAELEGSWATARQAVAAMAAIASQVLFMASRSTWGSVARSG
jgi:hypothetical protein